MRALAEARALGFLGPGPLDAHVASARWFLRTLQAAGAAGPAIDLGSGGGVPGLLLAAWLPEWRWTLLDVNRRRVNFLSRAIAALGLVGRTEARLARAEDLAQGVNRESFGTVTARSFASPAITAEVAAGLLRSGGVAVVAEPPGHAGSRWPEQALSQLGLAAGGPPDRHVMILTKVEATPSWAPRPWKKLLRAPLF